MSAILDLNNAFVYYVARILPTVSQKTAVARKTAPAPTPGIRNYLKALDTDKVTLAFTGDVTYNPPILVEQLQGTPEVLATSTFLNSASVTNTSVFRQSSSTTASFSTSFTKGIKIGAETKLQTGIPFLAEGQITLNAEGSFSSTQSRSSTETQTFSVDTTINVPMNSRVEASLMINSLQYAGTLTAQVQAAGRLGIDLGSNNQTVQISDLFRAIKNQPPGPGGFTLTDDAGNKFSLTDDDVALFEVTPDNEVLYEATATIDAKFGASQTVRVREFSLSNGEMVSQSTMAA